MKGCVQWNLIYNQKDYRYEQGLTLLHSEQAKLHRVLAILSAIGFKSGTTGAFYLT